MADWTELGGGLTAETIRRGITSGIARPNGGGSFIFGFHSAASTLGAVGFYTNQANFAPVDTGYGGSVRGCIQRSMGTSFSPFLFISLENTAVTDGGYLLGLQDCSPSRIVLRKGSLSGGLPNGVPEVTPGSTGILRQSTATFASGTWVQLRLDVVANISGDAILKVFQSNLTDHACTSPDWEAVAGMDDFVDDALGVNTGSLPYPIASGGYMGFAFASNSTGKRGYFDTIECLRQLP